MSTPTLSQIVYPDSDGEPMAENTLQFQWIVTIKENLEVVFRDRPDVFVAGDLLWYPVEGHPEIRQAPDAMVVFGRPKGRRGSYRQWLEDGIAPQVVFEVLSPGNRAGKMADKFDFYERYGVEEYYIYDPDRNELMAYQRNNGGLVELPNPAECASPRLGIWFELTEGGLRIDYPDGRPFLTFVELDRQRVEAERMACQERVLRDQEWQRAHEERERALHERQRAEQEKQRAEQEKQRAEQEKQRAEQEKQRAERLAAQLRALGVEPEA